MPVDLNGLIMDHENSRLPGIVGYFSQHVAPAAVWDGNGMPGGAFLSSGWSNHLRLSAHLQILVLAILRHSVRTSSERRRVASVEVRRADK